MDKKKSGHVFDVQHVRFVGYSLVTLLAVHTTTAVDNLT